MARDRCRLPDRDYYRPSMRKRVCAVCLANLSESEAGWPCKKVWATGTAVSAWEIVSATVISIGTMQSNSQCKIKLETCMRPRDFCIKGTEDDFTFHSAVQSFAFSEPFFSLLQQCVMAAAICFVAVVTSKSEGGSIVFGKQYFRRQLRGQCNAGSS